MNLKGQKIGMLTILYCTVEKPWKARKWMCRCDCGNLIERLESSLNRAKKVGTISSCGCTTKIYLKPGDSELCTKAGLHRKDSFVDGSNIQMTLRAGTISTNTSGCQGVSWSRSANKWHVFVGYQCYRANLGFIENLDDAINLRNRAEEAIKDGTFEDFYYQLKGYHLGEKQQKQFNKKLMR